MKKILIYLLALVALFSLVGCSKEKPNVPSEPEDTTGNEQPDDQPNDDSGNNSEEPETPENYIDLKVYFINVGQADCCLIILPNKETVLIDAGLDHATIYGESNFPSWKNIKTIFDIENISIIDHLIITHNHADHYYYVCDIMNQYKVKNVYMSGSTSTTYAYKNILSTIQNKNINSFEVEIGSYIVNEEKLKFQVVATQKQDNPADANFCSVITKLTYKNRSFLFTGDAGYREGDAENVALNSGINLKSDVLKVGHHGSTYSSGRSFLMAVQPEYAVITTATVTTTGHPHSAAYNRLEYYSKNILQSKNDGTILFISNGKDLICQTKIGD